ncbi:unnamed protein product [Rotaria sp. Silwood2]|nr:unnamed protein product [Rotaria sp. Silwood2]
MMITNNTQNCLVHSLDLIQQKQITEGDTLIIEVSFDRNLQVLSQDDFALLRNNRLMYNYSDIIFGNGISSSSSKLSQWVIRLFNIDLNDFSVYSIKINRQLRQDLFILFVKPRSIKRQLITLPKDEFYLNEAVTFECKFQAALYSKTYEPAWFKNGLSIEPSDRHLISIYELRNDYLVLETPFIRIVKMPVQPILSRTLIKGDDFEINLPINRNEQQLNQMIIVKDNQSMKDINKRIKYFDHKQVQFKLSNLILDDCGSYEIDEIGKRTHIYVYT